MEKIRCRLRNGIIVDADKDLRLCDVVFIPKDIEAIVRIGTKIRLVDGKGYAWGSEYDIVEKGIINPDQPKPEKTYTAALREKLDNYFLFKHPDTAQIENAIKAIVRLNKKYGKE